MGFDEGAFTDVHVCFFAVDCGFVVYCSFALFSAEGCVVFFDEFCVVVDEFPWVCEQRQFLCFGLFAFFREFFDALACQGFA